MVKRFISLLSSKVEGLHEAAYIIAGFSFLSQLLGLVRDRMLAGMFGAGETLDIYYAAFRIPDFLFAAIASLVSLFVLIPFLSEKMADGTRENARAFLSSVSTAFVGFMCVVTAIVWFFVPELSTTLYPGFVGEQHEMLVMLTRILLLSPIILGISNIFASVTQLAQRFFVYALSPILYNVGIIMGVVFLYPRFGMQGLVWGVITGSVLHALIQMPTVIRERLMPTLRFHLPWHELKALVLVSVPRTVTLALNQLALLVLVGIASTMEEGSITVFNFASNINTAPLSIIGVSYSIAAFPTLARLFSNGDRQAFIDQMLTAVRHIVFWSFPAIALIIVLRAHIVRTLLGAGAFDWADTRLTAAALALFIISLIAHSLMLVFVRGYYAAGKTFRPLLINTISSIGIVVLGYSLTHVFAASETFRYFIESLFRVEDVAGVSILMLPLAYSIGMIVNALAFWFLFRKDFGGHLPSRLYDTVWHSFSASVFAGFAAYMVLYMIGPTLGLETVARVFTQGLIAGIIGIVVGVLVLKMLKSTELREIVRTIRERRTPAAPVAPEPQEL
ncbi:MAG: murein biosynthesis integral membrane protein MurJ [Patescibacteria group bacterium]